MLNLTFDVKILSFYMPIVRVKYYPRHIIGMKNLHIIEINGKS